MWATARSWMTLAPDLWLLTMLRPRCPSVRRARSWPTCPPPNGTLMRRLFSRMRSGHGFTLDLRLVPDAALERGVTQPTLVMASPNDSVLPFAHTEHLGRAIPGAEVFSSPSLSHLIWFGSGAEPTRARIADFLGHTCERSVSGPGLGGQS